MTYVPRKGRSVPQRHSRPDPHKVVKDWNAAHSIGTIVRVILDDESTLDTVTVSVADVLGGHTPVIWVSGIRGAYLLSRVTPIGELKQ